MRHPPRKTVRAWALWSDTSGVVEGSVRRTRGEAIRAVWDAKWWWKKRREGWRVVAVEVTAVYFSSNKSRMQKV